MANVAVPLDELAGERLVVSRRDPDQHDRPIAGDGMRPEAGLAQTIGGDRFLRTQRGTSEYDGPYQAVEQGDVARRQAPIAQLIAAAAPRAGKRSVSEFAIVKLLNECVGCLKSSCRSGDEGDAGRGMWVEAHVSSQTEDWVQHGAHCPGPAHAGV